MNRRSRPLFWLTLIVLLVISGTGVWLHIQQQQYERNRQLIDALTHKDINTALALINAGADPNTPMEAPPVLSLEDRIDLLLHRIPTPDSRVSNAFMFACGEGWRVPGSDSSMYHLLHCDENLPLIEAMLAHGANVNAVTSGESTALYSAIYEGRVHTVELLLTHGANVNKQDQAGHTPLIAAAQDHTVNVTHLLLEHGANPNLQDVDGDTALYWAVTQGHGKVLLPELLAHGADPNVKTKSGDTPLLYAQKQHRLDLVALMQHSRN